MFEGDLKVCISSCLELPVISYLDGSHGSHGFHQVHGGIGRSGSLTALDVDWKGQRIITGRDGERQRCFVHLCMFEL